jgi:flavin reductase (DIM6/NTAB) family NADH-FMN oxidoreductase RutF
MSPDAQHRTAPHHDGSGCVDLEDEVQLRKMLAGFPSGVVAVAALVDDQPAGMVVSSFTSVSLRPPLISICIARTSTTWPLLRDRPRLGISVLSDRQHALCGQLSARNADRFASVPWTCSADGAVLLDEAGTTLQSRVVDSLSAGDHDIVVLALIHAETRTQTTPLVFHHSRFHRITPLESGVAARRRRPPSTTNLVETP